MVDRADELKETAAQCLALAHTTSDPQTRAALLTMAQKLYERANTPPADYEAAQRALTTSRCCRVHPCSSPLPRCSNSSKSSRRKRNRSVAVFRRGRIA